MNSSQEIQKQYLNLRTKVEQKIQELEAKLYDHSTSPYNPNNLSIQRQLHCHHKYHHCHHKQYHKYHYQYHHQHHHSHHSQHRCHHKYHHCCPSVCSHPASFSNQNACEICNAEKQNHSIDQQQGKNSCGKEGIPSVLVESLVNQRQINQKRKAMNQKIEVLGAHHNASQISEFFAENRLGNNIKVGFKYRQTEDECKPRYFSDFKANSQPYLEQHAKKTDKVKFKEPKNKIKSANPISSGRNQNRTKGEKSRGSKSQAKNQSEYFLSFGCLLHPPKHRIRKSPFSLEVYKDSQYGNRKHEKRHLLQAFKQQQRSRKLLISKVAPNPLNQYGEN